MHITFFETHPWEEAELKKTFKGHQLQFFSETLTLKNSKQASKAEILSVYIYSKVTKEILELFPNLRLITTRSTGYDHLDLQACRNRNIIVCNVPSYGENTVAEHAFALLLELSRRVTQTRKVVLEERRPLSMIPCFDLKGKTIGVVGTGRIGLSSIRIANGFGMKVIAQDIYENKEAAKELGFSYLPLEKLLKESDVITLHVLLTDQTRHLINSKNIRNLKKGAVIINTSRGPVIETDALVHALKSGSVAAAGLDVLEDEENLLDPDKYPTPEQAYLLKNPNVIYTPHSAFYSKESIQRILATTIENIQSFLKKSPINTIK